MAVKFIIVISLGFGFSLWPSVANSHEGPPYPLIIDHATEFGRMSVWTDPDVGDGTFTILLEGEQTRVSPQKVELLASSTALAEPQNSYLAERAPELDNRGRRMAYVGKIPFSAEGLWQVGIHVAGPAGSTKLSFDVEVTPPGPVAWQLILFLLPFLALAGLWLKATYMRRSRA